MAEPRGVPPGRAGRLWLTRRLRAGRLAADLLDRKLQVLRVELERFELQRERAGRHWHDAWRRADTWGLRGAMTAGVRELRLATPSTVAELQVTWDTVMGVRYPAEASCSVPSASAADRGPGGAALVEAVSAYQQAVRLAAAYGAASAACRVIESEIIETRRRLRAINDRWIPRLESRLTRLSQELDETEREETFRRHQSLGPRTGAPRGERSRGAGRASAGDPR
ncbi:MAG TPA: V-type ATP synthase subunit D [Micromonosporaceae bacterium]